MALDLAFDSSSIASLTEFDVSKENNKRNKAYG
jgi:hypothetical protein